MALGSQDIIAIVGVAAIVLLVFVYNRLRGDSRPQTAREEGPSVDPLLSRFAHHDGDVIGETVAVTGGLLVVKKGTEYTAVPVGQAKLEGDDVQVTGSIDWSAADEAGAAWFAEHSKGVDEQVTADLTKSEDVKAPAREAFERRQREIDGEE